MNTSSENMKSFWVWPLDVTFQGVNLKVTLAVPVNLKVTLAVNLKVTLAVAVNLKVTLAVAVNMKVTLAVNLKVTLVVAVNLKVPCSWLVGGKLELDTSSENMNSFPVLLLHHRGLFYERPISTFLAIAVTKHS